MPPQSFSSKETVQFVLRKKGINHLFNVYYILLALISSFYSSYSANRAQKVNLELNCQMQGADVVELVVR